MPRAPLVRAVITCLASILVAALAPYAAAQPGQGTPHLRATSRLVTDTVHAPSLEGNLYGDSPNRATLVYLPPS